MKEKTEIYSLHRYVDDNGIPDRSKMFVREGDSFRERVNAHLDPDLLRILDNQSEEVQSVAKEHLYGLNQGKGCPECLVKYKLKDTEKQIDLPLNPD